MEMILIGFMLIVSGGSLLLLEHSESHILPIDFVNYFMIGAGIIAILYGIYVLISFFPLLKKCKHCGEYILINCKDVNYCHKCGNEIEQ